MGRKPLLRALVRFVLPRDSETADFCAGSGRGAEFLNNTGLVTTYAFDPSPNIKLLSRGVVESARPHAVPLKLWRTFDLALCLTAHEDFHVDTEAWAQAWQNFDAHATRGVILSCGTGEVRKIAIDLASKHAPALNLDEALSLQLETAVASKDDGVCVFWRSGYAPLDTRR